VAEKGYVTPTPISARGHPAVLAGRDVLAGAQTGTGKTRRFILPILQNLASRRHAAAGAVLTPRASSRRRSPRARADYGRHTGLRTVVIFGGVSEKPQIEALRTVATCWWPLRGGCSISRSSGSSTCVRCAAACWTRPIAMLDMGFITIFAGF